MTDITVYTAIIVSLLCLAAIAYSLAKRYEITVFLDDKAPKAVCTVNMTPRRTQRFKAKPGEKFNWENYEVNKVIQTGSAVADQWGLVTIENMIVTKKGIRIKITGI